MTPSPCDIAFVTVNYNTRALVEDMLAFFGSACLPFSHQLVIVDNNSSDGSHELLSRQQNAIYIPAGKNLGYGRAINLGMAALESRYLCILNTDVILDEACLARIWNFMETTPDAGVVSPRITNRDGSTQGFIFFHSPLSLVFNRLSKLIASFLKRRLARANAPMLVDGVLGAFFLIRRSSIPWQNLFDEDFFFYYEDTDLAHRLKDAGVRCYALPDCALVHLGGSSTSIEGARMFYKSRQLYLKKHYGVLLTSCVIAADRLRLCINASKYKLLSSLCPTHHLIDKYTYYSAMRDSIKPGGGSP